MSGKAGCRAADKSSLDLPSRGVVDAGLKGSYTCQRGRKKNGAKKEEGPAGMLEVSQSFYPERTRG